MFEQASFPRRINQRLTLIFGLSFFLVLLVGGVSLYLTRSIFVGAEEIRRESERIEVADRIHSTIHHFIAALYRARILSQPLPDGSRTAYLQALETLLESEGDHEAPDEKRVVSEIHGTIADLARLSEMIDKEVRQPRMKPKPEDLATLSDIETRIQALAHSLGAIHRAKMQEKLGRNWESMQWVLGFYATFFLLGAVLMIGLRFFFSRTVAQPLLRLAQAASRIAEGDLNRQVPITSKDEIGQLSHTFNIMVERLRDHQERLGAFAAVEERERISQELHDSLAQDVALLHLKLGQLERDLTPEGSRKAKETLKEMWESIGTASEDIRQAMFGLRTMVSKGLGFIPTLAEYLHDFSELRKIPVDLRIDGAEDIRFSPQVEIQLIRIIHEALTNVSKHAAATRSAVKLERAGEFVKVTIEDDGKGFVLEEVKGKGLRFGLQVMRERAEAVGGRMIIESAPGQGTKVIALLPF